jgi:very-short-patch-repair endonuclease
VIIDALLRSGRWRPLYRGIYAAYTGTPPRESQLWAGVLRAGPGAALSHHTAAEIDGADGVHSLLEYRYVRDVEQAHGLPTAERQARLIRGVRFPRSQYLDNLYEPFGVAVELDGSAAHPVEDRWADIHRDNFCAGLGILTLRFSWADVTRRACAVAGGFCDVLRRRGWAGQPLRCGPDCTL